MPSWTGYYITISGAANGGALANTTQSSVTLNGPYTAYDGDEDGTPTFNGSDVKQNYFMSSGLTIRIDGVDYTTSTASRAWDLANGDLQFSPDFSGANNQPIVDALNASGGVIDSISFNGVFSNSFADPSEDYSLSSARFTAPVCFGAGTMIATPAGDRRVETLRAGDLVWTLDHGYQPIRWITRTSVRLARRDDRRKPIHIPQDCFGPRRPDRDLTVSPQHCILIQDGAGLRDCDCLD